MKLFHQPSAPEKLFRSDLWHNYHGGCGKQWLASSLTEVMWRLVEGSSRPAKIAKVDSLLRLWAQRPGNSYPHSGPFVQERLGLTSWAVQPEANWSKHNDTTIYHAFLEGWLSEEEEACMKDPFLMRILQGTRCMNRVFRILYQGCVWLSSREARVAGVLGRRWLSLYNELALLSWQEGKLRYPLVVKHHMVDHTMRDLIVQSQKASWCYNPLADSVQLDEDFIGHCARLSRRVSPISQALRVVERYRTRAMEAWKKDR